MSEKRSSLFWIGLALGLAAVAGVYALGSAVRATAAPVFVSEGGLVGQDGVVGLRFATPVNPASVEARLQVEPELSGRWYWQANTVWFDPRVAFVPGETYKLRLDGGAVTQSGQALASGAWTFTAREPWLAYLSPAGAGSEIWRVESGGSIPQQVTRTGGRVVDYRVARGGEMVYFSASNDAGGADIWSVERDGAGQTRLVDCGMFWCDGPAASPDGSQFAYSQRERQEGSPRPFLYTVETKQAAPLSVDTLAQGEYFAWSADGQRLAMFDAMAGAVRVVDFPMGRDTLFESNVPGPAAWAPDGPKLIFLHEDHQSGFAHVVIFQADLAQQTLEEPFSQVVGDDSGLPVWSPAGDVLLFSQRILAGSSSRQLYLIQPDGSGLTAVTDDLRYTTAAYQWSPDGTAVVFQRLQFGSSENRPEVVLWERVTQQFRIVAFNAARPQWLP